MGIFFCTIFCRTSACLFALRLRSDIDLAAGQLGSQTRVLAFLADSKRQLIVRNDDTAGLVVRLHGGIDNISRSECRRNELCHILVPLDDIDLLAVQLAGDVGNTRTAGTNACTDRIDVLIVRNNSDLGAVACLTRDGLDLDDTGVNFRYLQLKQTLNQPRVGAGNNDLRAAGAAANLDEASLFSPLETTSR